MFKSEAVCWEDGAHPETLAPVQALAHPELISRSPALCRNGFVSFGEEEREPPAPGFW